ncbi:MAG: tetratricopeptide repeat protein, partial [Methylococcales bacterium]
MKNSINEDSERQAGKRAALNQLIEEAFDETKPEEVREAHGIRKWEKLFDRCFSENEIELCEKIIQSARKVQDTLCKSCQAKIFLAEGELYQKTNDYESARNSFDKSLNLQSRICRAERFTYKAANNSQRHVKNVSRTRLNIHKGRLAKVLDKTASLELSQGKFPIAKRYFLRAVVICRELRLSKYLAMSLIGLAEVNRVEFTFVPAGEFLEEALSIGKEIKDGAIIADAQYYLGLISVQLAKWEEALPWFEASLATASSRRDKTRIATSRFQLGVIEQALGNHSKACLQYN